MNIIATEARIAQFAILTDADDFSVNWITTWLKQVEKYPADMSTAFNCFAYVYTLEIAKAFFAEFNTPEKMEELVAINAINPSKFL